MGHTHQICSVTEAHASFRMYTPNMLIQGGVRPKCKSCVTLGRLVNPLGCALRCTPYALENTDLIGL